ncbi:hypothetical protein FEM48_Zijuj02G0023000 [Ziziphus jujuba var. spinosa]|uniref:Uncharacterized protein n=1 Tax=Ziziphus jujuba var. spinosa TaxID=714518 RepID=A0A978VT19_ZIZJJ|nr:hypothetical protein FEM48_Zijuj02G0023000 [Ziziphus jujuba var. spinosa]
MEYSIHVSNWDDPGDAEAIEARRQLSGGPEKTVNHGVAMEVMEKFWDCARWFFQLPIEERKNSGGRTKAKPCCGAGFDSWGAEGC